MLLFSVIIKIPKHGIQVFFVSFLKIFQEIFFTTRSKKKDKKLIRKSKKGGKILEKKNKKNMEILKWKITKGIFTYWNIAFYKYIKISIKTFQCLIFQFKTFKIFVLTLLSLINIVLKCLTSNQSCCILSKPFSQYDTHLKIIKNDSLFLTTNKFYTNFNFYDS